MSTSATSLQDRLAGTWKFSTTHSSADFAVDYVVSTFRGSIETLDATLENGQLSGSAEVGSIKVKDDNLNGQLMAPDFFDAERYEDITFRSTSITAEGDQATLEGELTIKGETRPVTATGTVKGPAEDFMGHIRLGFTLETTIDRTAYGINWNAQLPGGGQALSNDVTLTVELEFISAA